MVLSATIATSIIRIIIIDGIDNTASFEGFEPVNRITNTKLAVKIIFEKYWFIPAFSLTKFEKKTMLAINTPALQIVLINMTNHLIKVWDF